jgi:hypothetical protein
MSIKEYIIEKLKEDGYGGLYLPGECGCSLEDFALCGDDFLECKPGYLRKCENCDEKSCSFRDREETSYCIHPEPVVVKENVS